MYDITLSYFICYHISYVEHLSYSAQVQKPEPHLLQVDVSGICPLQSG